MRVMIRLVEFMVIGILLMWSSSWALGWISSADSMKVLAGALFMVLVSAAALALAWHYGQRIMKWASLLVLAVLATGCGTTINPGYAGIVVDYYGKDRGVQGFTVTTGRVWYNPWTTKVLEYPTFVQSVVWTQNAAEGRPANEEITFTNKDQMQIAADVSLAYHLDVAKLPAFYVKFRSDDLDHFTYGYLHSLTRDKFNEIAGKYTIEQIMGDNGSFLKEVRDALQKDLDPIGVGLESQFGFIGAPRPPNNVIAAINAKAQAMQLAIQKQNELMQVTADANKEVAQAEGHAKAVLAGADAQARANRLISDSLSANLIELRRLEKWNGTLPTFAGGSVSPFISLK